MVFDFSAFIRSERCVKSIGWFKLTANIIIIITFIIIGVFFNSILGIIKKSMSSSSQFNFTIIFVLFILFLTFYAICTFILIIGTVNRDRIKVLIFIIFDTILTLIIFSAFYEFFFNFFYALLLMIQVMLQYSVIMFWFELRREHVRRVENQETRKRVQIQEQSYIEEIERYHARMKSTENSTTGANSSTK
ncbi:hypothetical protein PVAND_010413 [Polypedilum vanderplanki]|uniref:Uncharacterized protein n=1 Tax=Polypedilum vanderplanki TaxID=319348 RepID=A0A9J6CFG7_POLVA|nr:hypothetical protein PVAND_010413 [Polypedilum vanderplanki]